MLLPVRHPQQAWTIHLHSTTSFGDNQFGKVVGADGDEDFKVTVNGYLYEIDEEVYDPGNEVGVDSNRFGLIINRPDDDHTVDSRGSDESLKFTFGEDVEVELIDITIGWSEQWKNYSYQGSTRGGGLAEYDLFADGEFLGNSAFDELLPTELANMFAIGTRTLYDYESCGDQYLRVTDQVSDICRPDMYDFGMKLQSITVRATYDDTTVVPLPAAGWFLLGGLGGLAAMRRRQ